jgi:dipeptidyl aminopeptidase/acylaminoacyl peptidase
MPVLTLLSSSLVMKRVLVGLPAFIFLGAATHAGEVRKRQVGRFLLEGIPIRENEPRESMLRYLAVRPTALQSVSDDGQSVLITTRFGDTMQLHIVNRPMGARRQVTFFNEPILGASFVPGSGGRRLIFSRDADGKENWQLLETDLETGRTALLTDGKSRHESPVLSNDGRLLAFCGTGRNGRDYDIYLRDLASGGAAKLLWKADGMLIPVEFSPDNKKLLAQKYISERETRFFIVNAASGEAELITPHSPAYFYGGGAWDRDGKTVYLFSDRDGEFRKLYRVSQEDGTCKCLTPDIEWDVEEVRVDPAGRGIVFVTNEDGVSRLYFADSDGSNRRAVRLPAGSVKISGLTPSHGGEFGFTLTGARAPADAYTVSFPSGEIKRWTQREVGGLNTDNFAAADMIRYPTFDRVDGKPRMIPAFIFRGRGRGPRPAVIHAHGGPEFQYQPVFNSEFQYWATELGITVISPNMRGSTGYGRSFQQLDNDVKREDAVRDIGALLDWIARQPDLDAGRVGIFGGSYGGYMVLGSLMNYPGRIKCGIDVVGIADFVGFLEQTSGYRRDLRRAEYGDERDPRVRRVLEAISPLRHADRINAALFVVHGKMDTRVPICDAERIVAKMREMKRPVWFATALDEGHVFQTKPDRDLAAIMYALFWREHLLGRETPERPAM